MDRRTFTLLLSAPAMTLGSRSGGAATLQRVAVAVGGAVNIGYLPLTLADRLGYFTDAGLAVEVDDFTGGTKAAQALVGGSAPFMTGSYENVLTLRSKGMDALAVAALTRSHGIVIALRKSLAGRYRSPKDLEGLKFGVTAPGSSTAVALDLLLAKAGLPPSAVVQIGIGQEAASVAAVHAGEVDGVVLGAPVIDILLRDGSVVPIVDARTEAGQRYLYGGDIVAGSILTMQGYARAHPEIVQAMVTAIVRSLQFIHRTPTAKIMAAVPTSFYVQDRDLYRLQLEDYRQLFTTDGKISPQAAENTYRMLNVEHAGGTEKVDLAKTYTNDFAARADKRST